MSDAIREITAIIIIDELLYENEEEEMQPKKKRKIWSKNWLLKKYEFSNERLLKELKENEPEDYKNYMRIDGALFGKLLDLVKAKITKQDTIMRDAISAEVRLGITLRYLATGNSFADLKFSNAVSPQAIGNIVIQTCDAINEVLRNYIKLPKTSAEWLVVADKFYEKSKFPHCLGALDGKNVRIKKPPHSGSNYFNYKKTFSIVLMAIVNSNSEFLMVDIGTNGRISDGGVFNNTQFFKKFERDELNLPEPSPVIGDNPIPFVFVSDDAFSLRPNIMKPYTHSPLSPPQDFFNKRLSLARVKAENAFGILVGKFRLMNTIIALSPEKASKVVLSCCYLHNFIKKEIGSTRSGAEEIPENPLLNLQPTLARNSSSEAKMVRNNLCEALYALEN